MNLTIPWCTLQCGPTAYLLEFKLSPGSSYLPPTYKGCVAGCDVMLLDVLTGPRNSGAHTQHAQPSQVQRPTQAGARQPPPTQPRAQLPDQQNRRNAQNNHPSHPQDGSNDDSGFQSRFVIFLSSTISFIRRN